MYLVLTRLIVSSIPRTVLAHWFCSMLSYQSSMILFHARSVTQNVTWPYSVGNLAWKKTGAPKLSQLYYYCLFKMKIKVFKYRFSKFHQCFLYLDPFQFCFVLKSGGFKIQGFLHLLQKFRFLVSFLLQFGTLVKLEESFKCWFPKSRKAWFFDQAGEWLEKQINKTQLVYSRRGTHTVLNKKKDD